MPGTFTYGLYMFTWVPPVMAGDGITVLRPGQHQPPDGASCVIDFRTMSQQATAGQSAGYGLFAWAANPPGDLVSLGTGYAPTLNIDNAARNELKLKLGLSALPSGATLADAIADILGPLSDPTGLSGPRPLMPDASGTIEIHLAGHSRIWSGRIDAAQLLSASPTGRHNRIRDVIRADLQIADDVGKFDEALGAWLLRLGYSGDEVKQGAGGKKAEYQRLMPARWTPAKKNAKGPKLPKTQLVELWPSNGAITSGQTYTWAEETTAPWASGAAVSANKLGNTSNGTSFHGCRCSTAVSSADHWSTGLIRVNGSYQSHLITRMAVGAATCYLGGFYGDGSLCAHFVTKYVSGTATTLSVGTNIAPTRLPTAATGKTRSDGSTQSFELAGFATLTTTDTAITGNLFGGAGTSDAANNHTNYVGPVTIDDGLGGGGGASISRNNPFGLGLGCGFGP